jgi:hypothetical protein
MGERSCRLCGCSDVSKLVPGRNECMACRVARTQKWREENKGKVARQDWAAAALPIAVHLLAGAAPIPVLLEKFRSKSRAERAVNAVAWLENAGFARSDRGGVLGLTSAGKAFALSAAVPGV